MARSENYNMYDPSLKSKLINEEMTEEKENGETQWCKERKEILVLEREIAETKHKFHMQELEFERATSKLIHDQILERGRIQRAEEKKMFMMKHQEQKR